VHADHAFDIGAQGSQQMTRATLIVRVDLVGLDESTLRQLANEAKVADPVSKALAGIDIKIEALLLS